MLDYDDSRELFYRHAFGKDRPDKKWLVLSRKILQHAGGRPRALVSSGSHLYKKSERVWKYYIDKHLFSKDFIESDDQKDSIQLDDLKDSVESDDRKELDNLADSIESDDPEESNDMKDSILSDDGKESDDPKESDDLVQKKTFLENASCFFLCSFCFVCFVRNLY